MPLRPFAAHHPKELHSKHGGEARALAPAVPVFPTLKGNASMRRGRAACCLPLPSWRKLLQVPRSARWPRSMVARLAGPWQVRVLSLQEGSTRPCCLHSPLPAVPAQKLGHAVYPWIPPPFQQLSEEVRLREREEPASLRSLKCFNSLPHSIVRLPSWQGTARSLFVIHCALNLLIPIYSFITAVCTKICTPCDLSG